MKRFVKVISMVMALAFCTAALAMPASAQENRPVPETTNPLPGEEGYVHLVKNSTPMGDDIHKVELTIDGVTETPKEYSDIVVVLDNSGSMNLAVGGTDPTTRVVALKRAMHAFVSTLIGAGKTSEFVRIGVVYYGTSAVSKGVSNKFIDFTDVTDPLTGFTPTPASNGKLIDGLGSTLGGTNVHAGLVTANNMINSTTDFPPIPDFRTGFDKLHKYVVAMTDGEFNYYRDSGGTNHSVAQVVANQWACTAADEIKLGVAAYGLTPVTTSISKAVRTYNSGAYTTDFTNINNHAAKLYSIGLSDASVSDGLRSLASDEGDATANVNNDSAFYFPNCDSAKIITTFQNIANQMKPKPLNVGDVIVTDKIGPMFSLVQYRSEPYLKTEGPADPELTKNTASAAGRDITWTMDKISQLGTMKLTYYVKFNRAASEPDLWYDVNDYAYLDFVSGVNNTTQAHSIKYFAWPLINVQGEVKKEDPKVEFYSPEAEGASMPFTAVFPYGGGEVLVPYTPSVTPRPIIEDTVEEGTCELIVGKRAKPKVKKAASPVKTPKPSCKPTAKPSKTVKK